MPCPISPDRLVTRLTFTRSQSTAPVELDDDDDDDDDEKEIAR